MSAPLLHRAATLAVGTTKGNDGIRRVVNLDTLPCGTTGGVVAGSGIARQADWCQCLTWPHQSWIFIDWYKLTALGCWAGRSGRSERRGRSFCRHLGVLALLVSEGRCRTEAVPVGIGAAGHGGSEEGNGRELHCLCW